LAPVGEAFDDGRYRQVSYEVVKSDCVDTLIRTSLVNVTPVVTKEFKFTAWYDGEPPHDGTLITLTNDAAPMPVEVNSGVFFTVRTSEKETYPQGFPFMDLTSEQLGALKCIDVKNINLGNLKTTYRQYLLQSKKVAEECQETIVLQRPTWWTGDEKTKELNIKVLAVECA